MASFCVILLVVILAAALPLVNGSKAAQLISATQATQVTQVTQVRLDVAEGSTHGVVQLHSVSAVAQQIDCCKVFANLVEFTAPPAKESKQELSSGMVVSSSAEASVSAANVTSQLWLLVLVYLSAMLWFGPSLDCFFMFILLLLIQSMNLIADILSQDSSDLALFFCAVCSGVVSAVDLDAGGEEIMFWIGAILPLLGFFMFVVLKRKALFAKYLLMLCGALFVITTLQDIGESVYGSPNTSLEIYSSCRSCTMGAMEPIIYPEKKTAVLIGMDGADIAGEADAEDIRKLLITSFQYKKSEIELLRTPTVEAVIMSLLKSTGEASRGDSLFVFFAGHGERDSKFNALAENENDGRNEGIVLKDGVILDDLLHRLLATIDKQMRVTMVFDSCHSGSALDLPFEYRGGKWKPATSQLAASYPLHANALWKRRVTAIAACRDHEKTESVPETGRGYFTLNLVKLLSQGPVTYEQVRKELSTSKSRVVLSTTEPFNVETQILDW